MGKQFSYDIPEAVRSYVGRFKVKYDLLNESEMPNVSALHIDVKSIIKSIINIEKNEIPVLTLTSSLINLCGHYRRYFAKRGMNVTIYLYYVNDDNNNLNEAYDFASIILQYIDKIYAINCSTVDDVSLPIKYITNKHKINVILSKNNRMLQLISPTISVINPNKKKTMYYNYNNLYNKLTNKPDREFKLSYKLINIVQCLSGYNKKYTGISGMGLTKSLYYLEEQISKGIIRNDRYFNIIDFISDVNLKSDDLNSVIEGFDIHDIDWLYTKKMSVVEEIELDSYIIDKFSTNDLKNLNVKYFTGFDSLILEDLVLVVDKSKSLKW